ncbi:MAG: Electron transport complex, RnfABCDGE type, subunit [Rhodocyclaceae bacterium]|nr:Electron transport complex, RnfABCDGE type, subunit [Rhodocyclaceae bacterium]
MLISLAEIKQISWNGIWKQNSSLVQILGMCPLLAVTTTLMNGVMLSLATLLVMALSNFFVACLRNFIPYEIRIPVFILIAAALVTVVDLGMNAYMHDMYNILGIFIPLIITNCLVLARIEAFAAKNSPLASALDGAMMGVGMVWTLGLLGGLRELIGSGTFLGGIDLVVPGLSPIHLLPEDYPGFLVAILPPGAFIGLGCLVAWKNWIEARAAERENRRPAEPVMAGGCH